MLAAVRFEFFKGRLLSGAVGTFDGSAVYETAVDHAHVVRRAVVPLDAIWAFRVDVPAMLTDGRGVVGVDGGLVCEWAGLGTIDTLVELLQMALVDCMIHAGCVRVGRLLALN